MTINRSTRYEQIHNQVVESYVTPPTEPLELSWFKRYAPKWRNRVGVPRLVAEQVFSEASGNLRSVNPGIFRNDPEMYRLFGAAINAVEELSQEFARQNWRRFEGNPDA